MRSPGSASMDGPAPALATWRPAPRARRRDSTGDSFLGVLPDDFLEIIAHNAAAQDTRQGDAATRFPQAPRNARQPLVSRFRSSHHSAAPSFANFGIAGH